MPSVVHAQHQNFNTVRGNISGPHHFYDAPETGEIFHAAPANIFKNEQNLKHLFAYNAV
jgi:hypothetical protein